MGQMQHQAIVKEQIHVPKTHLNVRGLRKFSLGIAMSFLKNTKDITNLVETYQLAPVYEAVINPSNQNEVPHCNRNLDEFRKVCFELSRLFLVKEEKSNITLRLDSGI